MKKKKGFTLIEVIISLALIGIISLYILPSIFSVYENSKKIKDDSKSLFIMQEVLERSKKREIGQYEDEIDGIKIYTEISSYKENLKFIKVKNSKYELEVVVKKWEKKDLPL